MLVVVVGGGAEEKFSLILMFWQCSICSSGDGGGCGLMVVLTRLFKQLSDKVWIDICVLYNACNKLRQDRGRVTSDERRIFYLKK